MTTLPLSRLQKRLLIALGLALSLFTVRTAADALTTETVCVLEAHMPDRPAPPAPPPPPAPPTFRS